MRRMWRWVLIPWEWCYSKLSRSHPVPGGSGIGAWTLHTYKGQPVHLSGGQSITEGSTILELHLVNARMQAAIETNKSLASNEMTVLRHEYEALARAALKGEIPEFVAVYGLTLMSPLVRRLGFDVFPAENTLENRMIAFWQQKLRSAFHPTGRFRRNRNQLFVYWMARAKLLNLYARP